MNFLYRLIFAIILLSSISFGREFKNIIFLQSYYQGFNWEDAVYNSFDQTLKDSRIKYHTTVKYLDSKKNNSEEYYNELKKLYNLEFSNDTFDLIVANDDNAIKFAIRNRNELFNNAPILFMGVSKYLPIFDSVSNITGIVQNLAFKKTFELAIQQNPQADRLLIITDYSSTGKKRYKQIKEIIPELNKKANVYNNLTLENIVDTLRQSKYNTVLYLHTFNRDKNGNTYSNKEVYHAIRKVYNGPIYSVIKEFIELGGLGGYISNGLVHGKIGGSIAIKMLNGTPIDSIPIINGNIDLPEFSYPELKRLGISLESLPKNSIIHNKPFSFYETYKIRIWLVLTIIVLLIIIVVSLTIYIHKYKKEVKEKILLQEQLFHKSKMDAIGQLAGGIAHDFNNMLGGIIGATQLLEYDGNNLNSEQKELLSLILTTSERATDIASKLLSFSRKDNMLSTTISINQIVIDATKLLEHTIDKSVSITTDIAAENDSIIGDNSAIQNILINLGINAWHAMPNGGTLTISTHNIDVNADYCTNSKFEIHAGTYIGIDIRDTGTGIPKENIEKIFEPFFTTKSEGEGTGLGLAAVYRTIVNHRGEISLYSEEGVGTIFHILLPCENNKKLSSNTISINDIENLSGTVLLVDDEELLRVTGAKLLKSMGLDVITAINGEDALKIYKEKMNDIDVVISDMIMPTMNGSELFYSIKEINPNAKFIITSGFTKNESIEELKSKGLSGFIAKPYHKHELYSKISDIL